MSSIAWCSHLAMDKFKDACGVFGIYGHEDAAHITYLGLYALQHRGQESAGIAVANDGRVRLSKAMGYVSDVFNERVLAGLRGRVAIGHVRHSTSGDSRVVNVQPLLIECSHGQIALCHNGNLVNATEVRAELVRRGSIFQTNSDTEVVLHTVRQVDCRDGRGCHRRVGLTGARCLLTRAIDPRQAHRRS